MNFLDVLAAKHKRINPVAVMRPDSIKMPLSRLNRVPACKPVFAVVKLPADIIAINAPRSSNVPRNNGSCLLRRSLPDPKSERTRTRLVVPHGMALQRLQRLMEKPRLCWGRAQDLPRVSSTSILLMRATFGKSPRQRLQ